MSSKLDKELRKLQKRMKKYKKNIPADGRKLPIKGNEDYYNSQRNLIDIPLPICCQTCPNNYINNPFGGGVCCCSLPGQEMIRW